MLKYNIIKIDTAKKEELIHKAIPSIGTAKFILQDMERGALAAGDIVESFNMAFRRENGDLYRIEGAQFA